MSAVSSIRARHVVAVAIILLAGCESNGARTSPTPSTSPSTSASQTCHPLAGTCLGDLGPGTYTTTTFHPAITYTVPSGWNNGIDLPTNFLLERTADPVADFYGGNAISIMPNVAAAAQNCDEDAELGVARTGQAITQWLAGLPSVQSSGPQPATVGGLTGFFIDVRLAPTWTKSCPFGEGPLIPLIIAGDPAQFHRQRTMLAAGMSVRFYVLDTPGGGNIMIDVMDIPDGISLEDYLTAAIPVVESMRFDA